MRARGGEPLPLDGTVVIVGGSLAGLRAAEALRGNGFRGTLVMVGDEVHLPYDRPPLSKQVLAGDWPLEKTVLADRRRLDELRIEQRLGHRAVSLDPGARRVVLDDGSTVEGDAVVVATGARPRPLPGSPGGGALLLRTLDDAEELRRRVLASGPGARVVVVGAGFIGSEVASTCSRLGCSVTVVEAAPTPLSLALGEEVGRACGAMHERNGVELRTGIGVTAVRGTGTAGSTGLEAGVVELADGSSVPAEVVVVGIGVVPNVEWLEGSGLQLGNGVVCDHALFAADGVVAAGDLARWHWRHDGREELVRIEHWQMAVDGGVAAAHALLAGRATAPAFDPVPYFWSDQYGLKIQMIGHPDPTDQIAVVDGSLDDERFVVLYGRSGRLTAAMGIGRPRQLMVYRPLLAAGASWDESLALSRG
ncbi:MAG TPA: FAD-dependent oxidoreductase [Acidimicrobiales bacterium]|nr:FAD-dependent oxidoreductase [Acidimicrobiales bacterium]